jgi:hypothetical protein
MYKKKNTTQIYFNQVVKELIIKQKIINGNL